jgi:hypothetical protein
MRISAVHPTDMSVTRVSGVEATSLEKVRLAASTGIERVAKVPF